MSHVAIIGAGVGGLSAALGLLAAGHRVTVLERHGAPGGKMRVVESAAGPVDAGPTVLTIKPVFERLFAALGERLEDHVTLEPEAVLARHYWRDGTCLDLMADAAVSAENVRAVFGAKAAAEFSAFSARAERLLSAFEGPMMEAAEPSQLALALRVMRQPRLLLDMALGRSLRGSLKRRFSDPRLRQLFGRYATYVGGRPGEAPALLALIWAAEARGVWRVTGGMHGLARAMEALATDRGAVFRYGAEVHGITVEAGRTTGVRTADGELAADTVVFNGDPRALSQGLMGAEVAGLVRSPQTDPRSLSAAVLSFAGRPVGPELSHHTVFFGADPETEFGALSKGHLPGDPTLYVCAQGAARFEIIMNAPPTTAGAVEETPCLTTILSTLERSGLSFSPAPTAADLTTPQGFEAMFPASAGSLYGRSPAGMTSSLKRPRAETALRGLYLCGGGAHPGAGVPMAALSGQHAASAIGPARALTSPSMRTATPGGMSMGSATTASGPSASSGS